MPNTSQWYLADFDFRIARDCRHTFGAPTTAGFDPIRKSRVTKTYAGTLVFRRLSRTQFDAVSGMPIRRLRLTLIENADC